MNKDIKVGDFIYCVVCGYDKPVEVIQLHSRDNNKSFLGRHTNGFLEWINENIAKEINP